MTGEPERPEPRPEPGGAVITGVGWGAGLALARTLAGHGYAVHVTDPDGALATGAAEELGPPAFGSALDVRSPAACRAAAARTRRRAGSLEIWINNATAPSSGLAWELDERTRQRVLEVNLVGTINGTLAALEVMRAAGRGQVINVIPLPKVFFAPGQAVFSASRQAAIAFSVGVAADLRRAGPVGVSVSCLCPTGVSGDDEAPPSGTQQLAGLLRLALDDRATLLVTPEWRARLLRLYYLWPGPAATARRLLGGGGR